MKTYIKLISILSVILFQIISINISFSQGTYFHDADFVYLISGNPDIPIPTSGERRTVYWELSSIDTTSNRLDLCAGLNLLRPGPIIDLLQGTWYKNETNSNFNNDNPALRFIIDNPVVITDSITGVTFISLRENARKDLVVLRASGNMEVRKNEGKIQITSPEIISNVYGNMPATGKFTTDTLEDLAVNSTSGIRIFRGTGGQSPSLEENFNLSGYVFKKIYLAQINTHTRPLSIINNESNDRDEIVAQYGNNILIFINNNNNTTPTTPETSISFSDFLSDFKVADVNNDGYNDIFAVTQYEYGFITYGGISIFMNNNGTISTNPIYYNEGIRYVNSIEVADFNKDGWNDMVIDIGTDTIALFLNNKSSGLFSYSPTESFRYEEAPGPLLIPPINARKIVAADLYNKGGLGIILSGWPGVNPGDQFETMIRINATDTDAVPAPAYLFKELVQIGDIYRPKLILYNRGDRDFLKYKIYKKSPFTNYVYTLIDSTSNNYYIDYQETFTVGSGGSRPPDNCFYYVKAEDYSYKVSVNSDTIGYPTILCPSCPNEENILSSNNNFKIEMPSKYSITNFPNPFNPSTKIFFTVPADGNVKITVYNSIGQKVNEIVNEFKTKGSYIIEFNASLAARQGSNLPSGIYYYRIEAGSQSGVNEFTAVRKMLLVK